MIGSVIVDKMQGHVFSLCVRWTSGHGALLLTQLQLGLLVFTLYGTVQKLKGAEGELPVG